MKSNLIITFLIVASGLAGNAQEYWSLPDCVDYAIENNIALKRQQLVTDQYRADYNTSRLSILPTLNFQSQANMNFGRSVDPVTNDITFNKNLLNTYWIGSGVTLFNGFTNLNRISASNFMHKMGIELQQVQVDLLSLDIINAYYNVLMYRGVVRTATDQLEVSKQQLHRLNIMVETGAESRTTSLEMQSQVSNDKLLLTQAINNEKIALETLKQLLQLEPGLEFDITETSLLLEVTGDVTTDADSIYDVARQIMPGISALEYQALARKKELNAVIGEATPELRLSAGWSTGYYDAMQSGIPTTPFSTQLLDNNSQSVSATFTIPIFNRWLTGRNIKRARLNLQDSELQLQQELNTLYAQVNSASLELVAIKDEHLAAMDNQEYSDLAFTAVEKKFQTGLANATEFSEARRQKFYSEVNLLRTKLQFNLKVMTINYYLTGRWMDI